MEIVEKMVNPFESLWMVKKQRKPKTSKMHKKSDLEISLIALALVVILIGLAVIILTEIYGTPINPMRGL